MSQALLDAAALATGRLKTEVVCDEWQLPCVPEAIPLFGQSGDDRYIAVDKMILKGVDVLPHALINNVEEKLGFKGEKLREYVRWLSDRILSLRTSERYHPTLHIDVYGTIGLIFDMDQCVAPNTSPARKPKPGVCRCISKVRLMPVTSRIRSAC